MSRVLHAIVTTTLNIAGWQTVLAERDQLRNELTDLHTTLADGNANDGHHTHRELYTYRMLYHAHAAHGWVTAGIPIVKS